MKLPFSIVVGLILSFATASAFAGGGPENVLLLVNSSSDDSKTIANEYIRLRQIPANNVLYINWTGTRGACGANGFRDGILVPLLTAMKIRHIAPQIDYVVYSSDFPWKIELQELYPSAKFPPEFIPSASLNGATYLNPLIREPNPDIANPNINFYVPPPREPNMEQCRSLADVRSHGFRSRYLPPEQRYLLSTMLGVTRGRGNTVDEVLSYLRRSAAADGTRPNGTIYFMWNKDVRSTTRDQCFPAVAAQINATGARAVVRQGRLPDGAKDVAGMMIGTTEFSVAKSGIRIMPGAICEHLTSEGGVITPGGTQTPLSEFLRHGAAGASGTVTEPRALQAKFPLPSIQLHYVRGCSLAEAFYQSVAGPYQLLIIGDPLCQPWAAIPTINVAGIKPNEKVKGSITLTPSGPGTIGSFELFLDGRLVMRAPPGTPFPLDTTKLTDGYHELRIVGSRSDPIETQGRSIVPIFVNNQDATLDLKAPSRVALSGKLKVSVRQTGAKEIIIWQNSRELARVKGESGEVEISAATLGRGKTTLQAISQGGARSHRRRFRSK